MSNVKYLNDDNFRESVSNGLTLVDFYADWCGPCRTMAPVIEELAMEMSGDVLVAKLDIDASQQITGELGITSIPTCVLFKDGAEVERVVGVRDKSTFQSMIEKAR